MSNRRNLFQPGDRVENLVPILLTEGDQVDWSQAVPVGGRGTVLTQPFDSALVVYVRWDHHKRDALVAAVSSVRRLSLLELIAEAAGD